MQGNATKALQLVDREAMTFLARAKQEGKKLSTDDIQLFFMDLTDKVLDDNTGLIRLDYIGRDNTKKGKVDAGKQRDSTKGGFDDLKSTNTRDERDDVDEDFFDR